jgi:hypothetical protein
MELVGTMKAHIKSAIYDTTLGTNSAAPTQRASGGKPINKSDTVVCAPQARGGMPVNQCIEASMDDHLPKPLVAADLFTLIEKCCIAVDRPNSTTVSTSKK